MTARFRFITIAVLVTVQIGLGTSATYSYVANSRSSVPATPARTAAQASTAHDMYRSALAQAEAWRPGARLIADLSWLSWPTSAPDPTQIAAPVNGWGTFVFAGDGKRLAVVIDRGSGFILGQHVKTLGLYADEKLDPEIATVTAETAVMRVEALGGRQYRASCPDHRTLTKVALTNDPTSSVLLWVVTYVDDRHESAPDIIVSMNASNGEVVRKEFNDPPCTEG